MMWIVAIVAIGCGAEVVKKALTSWVKVKHSEENIERMRNGYPPIDEKGRVYAPPSIEARGEERPDFVEYNN